LDSTKESLGSVYVEANNNSTNTSVQTIKTESFTKSLVSADIVLLEILQDISHGINSTAIEIKNLTLQNEENKILKKKLKDELFELRQVLVQKNFDVRVTPTIHVDVPETKVPETKVTVEQSSKFLIYNTIIQFIIAATTVALIKFL
jgi:signal recognition particle GTPase